MPNAPVHKLPTDHVAADTLGLVPESLVRDLPSSLRRLRKQEGLSQRALSSRSGVPQSTIATIESGAVRSPSVAIARQLLSALPHALATRSGRLNVCPEADCLQNTPCLVGGGVHVIPRMFESDAGAALICGVCGSQLVSQCWNCQRPISRSHRCVCGELRVRVPHEWSADPQGVEKEGRRRRALLEASMEQALIVAPEITPQIDGPQLIAGDSGPVMSATPDASTQEEESGKRPVVFLIHRSRYGDVLKSIREQAAEYSVEVRAQRSGDQPGVNIMSAIEDEMRAADEIWILVTPDLQGEKSVAMFELGLAYSRGCPLIPILYRCDERALPLILAPQDAIDLHEIGKACRQLRQRLVDTGPIPRNA